MERAFRLIGLTIGARHRVVKSNMVSEQTGGLVAGDVLLEYGVVEVPTGQVGCRMSNVEGVTHVTDERR